MEDTVAQQAPAMALAEMPMNEDGTVDFRRLAGPDTSIRHTIRNRYASGRTFST